MLLRASHREEQCLYQHVSATKFPGLSQSENIRHELTPLKGKGAQTMCRIFFPKTCSLRATSGADKDTVLVWYAIYVESSHIQSRFIISAFINGWLRRYVTKGVENGCFSNRELV